MLIEDFIWSEKHRPKTVEEVIVPERIKEHFQGILRDADCPHLLLQGPHGAGKTTLAKAVCNELGVDWIIRNGNLEGDIALIKTDLTQFASTVSLKKRGKRKIIIIDEADRMSPKSYDALKGFMDQYNKNCSFILTTNFANRIPKEVRSRLTQIDFRIKADEKKDMLRAIFVRITTILNQEGVTFDRLAIRELMIRYAPDWRKCIDECQRYAQQNNKNIDAGVLATGLDDNNIATLFTIIRDKEFDALRKWVADNMDMEAHIIFRALFDHMHKYLVPSSVAFLITTLADYQYKAALVADQEINTLACLVTFTAEAEFK